MAVVIVRYLLLQGAQCSRPGAYLSAEHTLFDARLRIYFLVEYLTYVESLAYVRMTSVLARGKVSIFQEESRMRPNAPAVMWHDVLPALLQTSRLLHDDGGYGTWASSFILYI